MPRQLEYSEISVVFSRTDTPNSGNKELEEYYRSVQGRTRVQVDLTSLFIGLIPLVGEIGI